MWLFPSCHCISQETSGSLLPPGLHHMIYEKEVSLTEAEACEESRHLNAEHSVLGIVSNQRTPSRPLNS